MSLYVRDLTKLRPSFSLRAHFHAAPGEIVALSGPSGCGKTTILRMIAGLETADSGSVELKGKDITNSAPERREMGVVLQNPSLFYHLDLIDNVTFGMKARGLNRAERETVANDLLTQINLSHLLKAEPQHLSGGEQRRIALLRAVCWSPQALLLDEPLTGLDPTAKSLISFEIAKYARDLQIPCLIVSHDRSDLEVLKARSLEVQEDRTTHTRLFLE
jgi:putative spermidine/putrescine transport system ATP-binding protein